MVKDSLEDDVLAKVSSQPQSSYEAAATFTEFELKNIPIYKMDKSESYLAAPKHRECHKGLIKSYDLDKTIFSTYGPKSRESQSSSSKGTKSQQRSSGKFVQSEELEFEVADSDMPQDQEENLGNDDEEPKEKVASKRDWFTKPIQPQEPTDPDWNTFDELMSTPIDFSTFIMNGLKINNLTQETLLRPAFRLLKGTRSNSAELEYDFEECYKALLEKCNWENPEGGDYPFDLTKPLPLVMSGNLVTQVEVMRKHGYGYLQEIVVRRADNDLYRFKEGDFLRLRINDIKDMLLLVVQNRLTNLSGDNVSDFAIALRMFTRSLVIQKRVEDLQLGVESYQKKINITKPETTKSSIRKRTHTLYIKTLKDSFMSTIMGETEIPIVLDIATDLPTTPELLAVSPFLCSNDSKSEPADELPKGHVSLGSFSDIVSRWRAKVKSHPSSPSRSSLLDTAIPSVEISIVHIPPAPSAEILTTPPTCDIPTLVISASPAVRSYIQTTARKRTLRPVLTPARSEARRRARRATLSLETSLFDTLSKDHSHHSFENACSLSGPLTHEGHQGSDYATPTSSSFTGPSRKSRQSSATSIPSTVHTVGALSPARADLLPPHKRYRDIRAYIEAETAVAAATVDGLEDTIEIEVDVATGIDVPDGFLMPDAIKRLDQLEEGQTDLQARSLIADGERSILLGCVEALEEDELKQISRLHAYEGQRLWRMETFLMRTHGYHL
ncbi:hypothetical protein Tco_0135228 [Tanacetum coccineum]